MPGEIDNPELWAEENRLLIQIILPLLEEATQEGGRVALDALAELGVGTDPALVNVDAAQWAREHAAELVSRINEETKERIRNEIASSIEAGEPLSDLVKRIRGIIDNPVRARLIAMTEDTQAFAEGNTQAWGKINEEFGAEIVKARRWRTVEDFKVCPICRYLNGKTAKMGEPFILHLPGQPERPVINPGPEAHIGCRCAISPVVA